MSFDNPYGEDMYFDHVDPSMYPSYINSLIQNGEKTSDEKIASLANKENQQFAKNETVYDYLERNRHDMSYNYGRIQEQKNIKDAIMMADLRKRMSDNQSKYDIYFIIIICMLVYIILQMNSPHRPTLPYFGSGMSMGAVGGMQSPYISHHMPHHMPHHMHTQPMSAMPAYVPMPQYGQSFNPGFEHSGLPV